MSAPQNPQAAPANRRWWIWLPLLGVGGWLALFGDKSASDGASVAVPVQPAPRPAGATTQQRSAPAPSMVIADAATAAASAPLVLLPREQLVRPAANPASSPMAAGSAAGGAPNAKSSRKDLFGTRSWNPPPPPPPPPAPAPPPMAPALPFVYLGKKLEGEAWEVYLGHGEQSFVVREGMVLEGTYRIDRIAPPQLSLTYLPLGQAQTLSIGDTR